MFLEKILPSGGLYCVALLLQGGKFRHYFYDSLTAAEQQLAALDKQGHNVYIAQAVFDPEKIKTARAHNAGRLNGERMKERSQANATFLKNFFLDIDCGAKWPLKNQREGAAELRRFIDETGLPMPAVVNSGNGLYAHWVLDAPVPAAKWQMVARILKQVVASYSPALGGDSSRTSDSASVLRLPGLTNRKPGYEPKPVQLIHDEAPISLVSFAEKLGAAARRKKLDRTALMPPKPSKDINAEFMVAESRPSDPSRVAEKCAQIAALRDSQGNVPEPTWYACLGVLAHCEGGREVAQEWSAGHPDYSFEATEKKITQWLASGYGPSTCTKLYDDNPDKDICLGCQHKGKIKSPIVLGFEEAKPLEIPEEQIAPPPGFRRTEKGIEAAVDDRWDTIYPFDLYVDRLAYDESLGYEVMTIKYNLPHEGWMECTIRSSLVNDPKALLTSLYDNHIKVVGAVNKKYMVAYMESYQARLQEKRRMTKLMCQMGWKEGQNGKDMIVLGKNIFHADGRVEDASLARNVPKAAEAFHTAGSLKPWVDATAVLALPGLEPHAFGLLMGIAAPLMRFTGFEGGIVSMVGDSGAGKTLIQRWGASFWGKHNEQLMRRGDTANMMFSRLGVLGTLPAFVEEVTNMEGNECSQFVYAATQGQEKGRLTREAIERRFQNKWNTVVITSSNASLVDKLSGSKLNASAEINRVLEYYVNRQPGFQGKVTEEIFWTIHRNYGHAGVEFARWMVQNVDKLEETVMRCKSILETAAGVRGEERYWFAMAAIGLAAGHFAKHLGLIKFDIQPIGQWVVRTILSMRGEKITVVGEPVSILGQFIDAHAGERLIVSDSSAPVCRVIELPRNALSMRYEADTCLQYISRQAIKSHITKGFGSYNEVKTGLMRIGALLNADKKVNLGRGTHLSGVQQPCWEIDMRCAKLGALGVSTVETGEVLSRKG